MGSPGACPQPLLPAPSACVPPTPRRGSCLGPRAELLSWGQRRVPTGTTCFDLPFDQTGSSVVSGVLGPGHWPQAASTGRRRDSGRRGLCFAPGPGRLPHSSPVGGLRPGGFRGLDLAPPPSPGGCPSTTGREGTGTPASGRPPVTPSEAPVLRIQSGGLWRWWVHCPVLPVGAGGQLGGAPENRASSAATGLPRCPCSCRDSCGSREGTAQVPEVRGLWCGVSFLSSGQKPLGWACSQETCPRGRVTSVQPWPPSPPLLCPGGVPGGQACRSCT